MQKFIINMTREDFSLLNDDKLECFILDPSLTPDYCLKFAQEAKKMGKLTLGTNKDAVDRFNLDGLIIDLSKSQNIRADFAEITAGLKDKIKGIICRNRRHEAMLAAECEPDAIIFRAWADGQDATRDLTAWYSEMFLIQSALLPMENNVPYQTFPTDFVILNDSAYHTASSNVAQ